MIDFVVFTKTNVMINIGFCNIPISAVACKRYRCYFRF